MTPTAVRHSFTGSTSCPEEWPSDSHGLQRTFGKMDDALSPPAAHLAPSGVLDASQQGGSSQPKASLFSLHPTIKLCGVLCSGTLCSSSGGQSQGSTALVQYRVGLIVKWPWPA